MSLEKRIPIAKFDRKGRIVCPTCGWKIPVPPDRYLARGMGDCPSKHPFAITDEVSFAVNGINSKKSGRQWIGDILKNSDPTPDEIKPKEEGGQIILPNAPPNPT